MFIIIYPLTFPQLLHFHRNSIAICNMLDTMHHYLYIYTSSKGCWSKVDKSCNDNSNYNIMLTKLPHLILIIQWQLRLYRPNESKLSYLYEFINMFHNCYFQNSVAMCLPVLSIGNPHSRRENSLIPVLYSSSCSGNCF